MKAIVPLRDDLFFPLEQTFEKFYRDFFGDKSNFNIAKSSSGYPKTNAYIDGEHFKMLFSVPGVSKDDLVLCPEVRKTSEKAVLEPLLTELTAEVAAMEKNMAEFLSVFELEAKNLELAEAPVAAREAMRAEFMAVFEMEANKLELGVPREVADNLSS